MSERDFWAHRADKKLRNSGRIEARTDDSIRHRAPGRTDCNDFVTRIFG